MAPDEALFCTARTVAARILEERMSIREKRDASKIADDALRTLTKVFDLGARRAALRLRLIDDLACVIGSAKT